MRLNAVLAVSRTATRRLDGVAEDAMVDRADDAWVLRRTFANLGLGKALGLDGLFVP
jgi:hypothetical protein